MSCARGPLPWRAAGDSKAIIASSRLQRGLCVTVDGGALSKEPTISAGCDNLVTHCFRQVAGHSLGWTLGGACRLFMRWLNPGAAAGLPRGFGLILLNAQRSGARHSPSHAALYLFLTARRNRGDCRR